MNAYLLDTNILIDFLRGKEKAIIFIKGLALQPVISTLTVAELFAGVKGKKESVAIHNLIDACEVIPVNEEIAEEGGQIKNKYQKSHQIGLADALIAATANILKMDLVTLNQKHFPMLKNIIVPY
ncbi:MAG: type II toxin-antitoxin system VapC family toxin [Candidatus Marinimicrobia bacterium]|nr:type II toxin-antitoxin system VapC family toxin [Candidatus Neomarinimicrobiota bacterium]MBL7010810.1 type II toxin-antitoxin system VapC family toxin [Candidatus Neomarinimicrobiota bacterium]MBL7031006.1 type II toxin-antitoxin system VapC family toxin [Candidatus Neomarinimicrobiota bacterium]